MGATGCLGPMENKVCLAHFLPLTQPPFMKETTYPPPGAPALLFSLRLPRAHGLARLCLYKLSGEQGSHTPCNLLTHSQNAPELCELCFEYQGHGRHYEHSHIWWVAGGNNALSKGQTDRCKGFSLPKTENGPPKACIGQIVLSRYSSLGHQAGSKGSGCKGIWGLGEVSAYPPVWYPQLMSSQGSSRETQC